MSGLVKAQGGLRKECFAQHMFTVSCEGRGGFEMYRNTCLVGELVEAIRTGLVS